MPSASQDTSLRRIMLPPICHNKALPARLRRPPKFSLRTAVGKVITCRCLPRQLFTPDTKVLRKMALFLSRKHHLVQKIDAILR